ncbi:MULTISPECIES: CDF family Co(II)/Ni(II) efflux transporter DmeF [unclassified Acidocella]|uniref:CDF family Co(II)/Ni(II) efflux transporter DmeF n=1 Tax=unclassified Acidocella TaxID=2648610 RepID=UPI00028CBADB|nr:MULTISPECIES: CDF family Co(II)/Ni(II) efflux transporter DmeF [unclassified Acidocella]EKM99459.1 Co/Zn/Cd efflux system component [Acidocella sp. MX-AZ02]WBO58104.1 CDF family Co(II)/Ni(II) efflux transporter DmeF [Acidocella sp. MX-AZ03]
MSESNSLAHEHVFLGADHANSERRTWWVIALCGAMMLLEIVGGWLFGSLALVADGLHMSTHAGALLLAALAYRYARRHARDPRFSFGTGKLGDLAGFTSAIILAMIALLIFYEAVGRFFSPVPIDFAQALPIAGLGLVVNIASAWLLSGGHHHHHGHSHGHGHDHDHDHDHHHHAGRDNNMRAALVHVAADAAVSLAVIIGLLLARAFGWVWMDPLVGVLGAVVILSWSYGLLRDTGAILLDMIPDQKMERAIRGIVNRAGDEVLDLHLWRLGPGHLGAILSVASAKGRDEDFYRARLEGFEGLSHITIEIRQRRI